MPFKISLQSWISGISSRQFWVRFAVPLAAWYAAAIFLAMGTYSRELSLGHHLSFRLIVKGALLSYSLWAGLTPIVLWMAKRVRLSRGHVVVPLILHLGFFLLVNVVALLYLKGLDKLMQTGCGCFQGPFAAELANLAYVTAWKYCPLVACWHLMNYQRQIRDREVQTAQLETQLMNAQMEALRNELHPHFLFNTLNSISALMQSDSTGAKDMLRDLRSILQVSCGTASQEISLWEEIDFLTRYLRIQKRRFGSRLAVHFDISPITEQARIPTLLLQPIVENGLRHGIANLPGQGVLSIHAVKSDSCLVLEVKDNGPGLPPHYKEGVGLSNTRMRIATLYGPSASLGFFAAPDTGLIARISIPFLT